MISPLTQAYAGKRVILTGHTGFKGAWLTEWLVQLGAEVTGYSLPSPTNPALFNQLELARRINHVTGDIREAERWGRLLAEIQPDFVFHLAAQPLVRTSYGDPVETFSVNSLGTAYVLNGLRELSKPCAVVCITTDKCYENREWLYGYREDDPLGGHDPYSASKAAAELVIASFRRSFFHDSPIRIASARAGNVIGGGDWAMDRIIPDCVRALTAGTPIPVRNRLATRPWQHVLEPLSGYLWLGARLTHDSGLASAFNFGPTHDSDRTVQELVETVLKHWPGAWKDYTDPTAPHEASRLQLSTDKAHALLGWVPVWSFEKTIEATVQWYRQLQHEPPPERVREITLEQITDYQAAATKAAVRWTTQAI